MTRLRLRSWRFLPAFARHAIVTRRSVMGAPGFLDGRMLADRKRVLWTITRWTGEAALRHWVRANPHGRAMTRLAGWCDEASVVRWQAGDGDPFPEWVDCHGRLVAEGRPNHVDHPSVDHQAWRIALPGALWRSSPLDRAGPLT